MMEHPRLDYTCREIESLHLERVEREVLCSGNKLQELYIPDTVRTLICDLGAVDPRNFANQNITIELV